MSKEYDTYLLVRNEWESSKESEQKSMDKIILNCSIGLFGIAITFLGIIFNKNPIDLPFLYSALVLILSLYLSHLFSVKDADECLDKLSPENPYEDIKSKYFKLVNLFNIISLFFLIFAILHFAIFLIANLNKI